jgi:hypothetical protein
VRPIIKHKPWDDIIFDVESILLDVQRLIDSENDMVSVSSSRLVDIFAY